MMEEIAKAKAKGAHKEREPTIEGAGVIKLGDEGTGATEIAKHINIGWGRRSAACS